MCERTMKERGLRMKSKVKSYLGKVFMMLSVLALTIGFQPAMLAKADADAPTSTPTDSLNWITDGSKAASGIFKDLTETAKVQGASAYSLTMVIAVIALVASIIMIGIQLTRKNSQKREEAKSSLVGWIIGALVVFGAMSIISLVQIMAANIKA